VHLCSISKNISETDRQTEMDGWTNGISHLFKRTFILTHEILVGFEVLTAVSTKMAVFWVVAPCSLVEVYQRFGGPHRPDDGGSKDL
jgi:hypothetical protein